MAIILLPSTPHPPLLSSTTPAYVFNFQDRTLINIHSYLLRRDKTQNENSVKVKVVWKTFRLNHFSSLFKEKEKAISMKLRILETNLEGGALKKLLLNLFKSIPRESKERKTNMNCFLLAPYVVIFYWDEKTLEKSSSKNQHKN